jgi:antitoxin component of MazEF toxin-antitoxin module
LSDLRPITCAAGNSLALRVAPELGASVGKAANMEVRDGKLVVEIAKPIRRRRRYTLDQLVAGITPVRETPRRTAADRLTVHQDGYGGQLIHQSEPL